jgi:lipid-binding SYLF domain-containing protein
MNAMKLTTGMALVLTAIAGLLVGCASAPASRAEQNALLQESAAAMQQMRAEDPALAELVRQSYGYAMFPKVTKGGLVVGGASGQGVVYERAQHVGYCNLSQASVGLQAGAQTFSELLLFENREALDQFKAGSLNFGADASAVVLESGAATNATFVDGVAVMVRPISGAMVEASIGGQQFSYQAK